jgi:hypothetical protein
MHRIAAGWEIATADSVAIPFGVVVLDVLRHRTPEVPFSSGISRSRHSSVIDRAKRSAYAFAFAG